MRSRFLSALGFAVLAAALVLSGCEGASTARGGGADPTPDAGGVSAEADVATAVADDNEPPPTDEPADNSTPEPTPDPPAEVCSPGAVQCDGNAVVACKGSGDAWYEVEACGPDRSCNPESASCEAGCVAQCQGKACGGDGCGGDCGTCEGGALCTEFGACGSADLCFDSGTGIYAGDQIANVAWISSAGEEVFLHESCWTKGATLLVETAGW